MGKWLKRVRGAIGMGLTWAAAWAVAGVLIGVSSILLPFLPWDVFFSVFDAPLPAMAVPGFVGGVLFSTVLGIVGRRRRFDELSVPLVAAAGAAGGLLLTIVPAVMVGVGLASAEGSTISLWKATAIVCGPFTVLSALSAAGSLLLARRAESRAVSDAAELGALSADDDAPQLLAGADWAANGHDAAPDPQLVRRRSPPQA